MSPSVSIKVSAEKSDIRSGQYKLGLQAIANGQVALILLAGGSSSRFNGSKYLKKNKNKKSIIELLLLRLKKIQKMSEQICEKQSKIKVLIMCTSQNYQLLQRQLKENKYFNMKQNDFKLIIQTQIPVVDLNGKFVLNSQRNLITYPRGTGQLISVLRLSKAKKYLQQNNTKYLYISGLENIMQIPCDPFIIGQMMTSEADIVAKCVQLNKRQIDMIKTGQYKDIQQSLNVYATVDGKIKSFPLSNILNNPTTSSYDEFKISTNSMVFKLQYIYKLMQKQYDGTLISCSHVSTRKITHFNPKSGLFEYQSDCYVFQNDLIDLFQFSDKINLLNVSRQFNYMPIITQIGQYSFNRAFQVLDNIYPQLLHKQSNIFEVFKQQQRFFQI